MKKGILIIDDEPAISPIIKKPLITDDFEADIATTVVVAKEKLDKNNYDLCLIDIRTPGMSGMELYHHLKREHPELVIKVMLTIGDVLSGNVDSFLGEVYRPCLHKPFTTGKLRAIIREAATQMASDGPSVVIQSIIK